MFNQRMFFFLSQETKSPHFLGGPNPFLLGLFFAPVSETQNLEIQKIRKDSVRKSEMLSETDFWDFPCRQNSGTKIRNQGFGKHFLWSTSRLSIFGAGHFPVQNSKMHEAQLRNGGPRKRQWIFRIFDFPCQSFPNFRFSVPGFSVQGQR